MCKSPSRVPQTLNDLTQSLRRRQTFASPSSEPLREIVKGSIVTLKVNIPPKGLTEPTTTAYGTVTEYDPSAYRTVWTVKGYPTWLLRAERIQVLSEVDGDPSKTKYETVEEFNGLLAYIIKWWIGKDIKTSFNAGAKALKDRVEST